MLELLLLKGLAVMVPCCFCMPVCVQIIDAVPKQPNTTFLVLVMKRWGLTLVCTGHGRAGKKGLEKPATLPMLLALQSWQQTLMQQCGASARHVRPCLPRPVAETYQNRHAALATAVHVMLEVVDALGVLAWLPAVVSRSAKARMHWTWWSCRWAHHSLSFLHHMPVLAPPNDAASSGVQRPFSGDRCTQVIPAYVSVHFAALAN
jgi:hypothetical protein